jgi:hypothetical protein
MPKWQWLLGLMVVAEMVWILSSVFRGNEEERRRQRQRPRPRGEDVPPNPERRPATNVDRFLEEINRRRREASERQVGTPTRRPGPVPLVRDAGAGRQGTQRRPSITQRPPSPPARSRVAAPVLPSVEAAATKNVAMVVMDEEVLSSREMSSRPPVAIAAQPAAGTAAPSSPPVSSVPVVSRAEGSPVLPALLGLLQNRQSLQAAFALQEIFGPPRCRRPRARHPVEQGK